MLQYILVKRIMLLIMDIICDFSHQVKNMKNENKDFSLCSYICWLCNCVLLIQYPILYSPYDFNYHFSV